MNGVSCHHSPTRLTRVIRSRLGSERLRLDSTVMVGQGAGELVATKLQVPTVPGGLVRRARLDTLLDRAVAERHRLVLVSAPAGSGKSTLLAGSLADRDDDLVWVQMEPSDADPVRFWSYLVGAVDGARPGVRDMVEPAIVSTGGSPDSVVPEPVKPFETFLV